MKKIFFIFALSLFVLPTAKASVYVIDEVCHADMEEYCSDTAYDLTECIIAKRAFFAPSCKQAIDDYLWEVNHNHGRYGEPKIIYRGLNKENTNNIQVKQAVEESTPEERAVLPMGYESY